MDKTVLLTRDEASVPQHLGETDKTVLLTRDEASVPRHLGEIDNTKVNGLNPGVSVVRVV